MSAVLLVVSALITQTVDGGTAAPFRDGVVTRRNTFQKHLEQQELHQFIEDALETTAVPVSLGIFYVFRNPTEQQDFLAARAHVRSPTGPRSVGGWDLAALQKIGGKRSTKNIGNCWKRSAVSLFSLVAFPNQRNLIVAHRDSREHGSLACRFFR